MLINLTADQYASLMASMQDAYHYRMGEAYDLDDPDLDPDDREALVAHAALHDALVSPPFGLPDVLDELRLELASYDETSDDWSAVNNEEDDAPSVGDCEDHSDRLEQHAHDFARLASHLIERIN